MAILILGDKQSNTLNAVYEFICKLTSHSILWLDDNDIVNNIIINDDISLDKSVVRWSINSEHLTSLNVVGVFNQLGYLKNDCFKDFHPEDIEYAKSEFNAYLLFALNQFKNVINKPWNGGLTGFCQSMPYQWHYVKNLNLAINIPEYYFGLAENIPSELANKKNIIVSNDIYNYGHWTETQSSLTDTSSSIFFYKKPLGIPIVITVFKNIILTKDLYNNCPRQEIINEELVIVVSKLMEHFNLTLATILVFVDDDLHITLGSIEPSFNIEYVSSNHVSDILKAITNNLTYERTSECADNQLGSVN